MTDETEPAAPAAPGSETDFVQEAMAHIRAKAGKSEETKDEPAASVDAPGEGEGAAETPAEEAPKDIWATAPEDLRAAREALEAERTALTKERDTYRDKWNRERGRTSALTKKLNAPAAEKAPGEDPFQKIDKAHAEISEDFPEMGEKLTPFADAIKTLHGNQRAQAEREAESHGDVELQALIDGLPDWEVILSNAKDGAFWEWTAQQPKWIQQLAELNREEWVDGEAAAFVIGKFRDETGPPQSSPQGAPPIKPDTRRERQLSGAAAPKPSARVTVADPPDQTQEGMTRDALEFVKKRYGR